jgi:sialic acid synthase SpsE
MFGIKITTWSPSLKECLSNNIRSVRPGYGMHPKYLKDILGKVTEKDWIFGDRFV